MKKAYLALATAAAVGIGGLAAAAPASAAPVVHKKTCSIAHVKKGYDVAINHRLATLTVLGRHLTATKAVSAADRTTAQQLLAADAAGLKSVKASVDAATTCSALKALGPQITKNYRVYALVVPQITLLDRSSVALKAAATVQGEIPALTAAINAAESAGKDVTAERAELATATTQSAAAISTLTPMPSAVLTLTPADVNARNGKLHTLTKTTATGVVEVAKARKAVTEIVTVLG